MKKLWEQIKKAWKESITDLFFPGRKFYTTYTGKRRLMGKINSLKRQAVHKNLTLEIK